MSNWKQRFLTTLRDKANLALKHHPIALTQEDLQLAAERQFPRTFQQLVPITLQNPYLRLHKGSDQIGIELDVSAEIAPHNRFISRWLLIGQITYNREQGEFYLYQPDIRSLDAGAIFEALNAPGIMRGLVIEELLGGLAASTPLFRLQTSNPRHTIIRRWLRSVHVEDGKLLIKLGIDQHLSEDQGLPTNQS